jgi:hypothetical protein
MINYNNGGGGPLQLLKEGGGALLSLSRLALACDATAASSGK